MAEETKLYTKLYIFHTGTDYLSQAGQWERAEIGDTRGDLLPRTAKALLAAGVIEIVAAAEADSQVGTHPKEGEPDGTGG